MRKNESKLPGIVALIIGGISLFFYTNSFILALFSFDYETRPGNHPSFSLWIFAVIISYFSLIPFAVDAILCIIRVFMRYHTKFNLFTAMILLGGIPMGIFVGQIGDMICIVLWYLYLSLMCFLEVISVIQIRKDNISKPEESILESNI